MSNFAGECIVLAIFLLSSVIGIKLVNRTERMFMRDYRRSRL